MASITEEHRKLYIVTDLRVTASKVRWMTPRMAEQVTPHRGPLT